MARVAGGGAVRAATCVLLALALIRSATVFMPSMWAWGLNVLRFEAPWPGWLLWLAMVLPLIPAVGEAAGNRLEHASLRMDDSRRVRWLIALVAAALVWSLPDRTWFTGDFMLRQGVTETRDVPGTFIQSLPLERLLERTLPRLAGAVASGNPNVVTRVIEALAAAALSVLSGKLAREWGLTGSAAMVAAGTIFFGGYLTFFTGLGKPAAPLCVFTAAALLGATRLVRAGRSGMLLGLAVALAFMIHRSGLALAPLWIAALVLARSTRGPAPGSARVGVALAVALPLAALLVAAPALWRILTGYDLTRHLRPGGVGGAGILALAVAPLHLIDLANLLFFYTPVSVVMIALLVAPGSSVEVGAERRLPLLLVLSFVPLLLLVHPIQGVLRDLEVFAPAGVACAMLAARGIGRALQRRALPIRLAPALLAAVVAPALQWLLHFHDPDLGLARARAAALEAPTRTENERARLWDALAYRAFRDRRWDRAVEASEQAVRYAPSPRAITMLAIARTSTGDDRGAESLYVALADRTPDDPLVWLGLGGAALRLGDSLWSARALARLEGYAPGGREARLIRRHLQAFPQVWPGAAESARGSRKVVR